MVDTPAFVALIEPEAKTLGFDLVRVKLFGKGDDQTLQVMAERPDTRQLTIDDCSDLSRRISDVLDAADSIPDTYRLEVSSPGIDRPLTRLKDFADWKGHEARITLAEKLDGQKTFKGDLAGVEEKGEVVMIRSAVGTVSMLPFELIHDAKLTITDRLLAATAPLSSEGAEDFEDEPAESAEAEETN